jgi:hypothetical protein
MKNLFQWRLRLTNFNVSFSSLSNSCLWRTRWRCRRPATLSLNLSLASSRIRWTLRSATSLRMVLKTMVPSVPKVTMPRSQRRKLPKMPPPSPPQQTRTRPILSIIYTTSLPMRTKTTTLISRDRLRRPMPSCVAMRPRYGRCCRQTMHSVALSSSSSASVTAGCSATQRLRAPLPPSVVASTMLSRAATELRAH